MFNHVFSVDSEDKFNHLDDVVSIINFKINDFTSIPCNESIADFALKLHNFMQKRKKYININICVLATSRLIRSNYLNLTKQSSFQEWRVKIDSKTQKCHSSILKSTILESIWLYHVLETDYCNLDCIISNKKTVMSLSLFMD